MFMKDLAQRCLVYGGGGHCFKPLLSIRWPEESTVQSADSGDTHDIQIADQVNVHSCRMPITRQQAIPNRRLSFVILIRMKT